ncbi:MAG TPA: hypothetical protein VGA80_17965, partial [Flavobacteriaceae bacterium]
MEAIHKQLTLWTVLYLYCPFLNPIPKNKFLILLCKNPLLLFTINSEVSLYIQTKDKLWPTQVKIEATTHSFLSYDSWADFSSVIEDFSIEDIEKQILNDHSRIKGEINENKKSTIILAPKNIYGPIPFRKDVFQLRQTRNRLLTYIRPVSGNLISFLAPMESAHS